MKNKSEDRLSQSERRSEVNDGGRVVVVVVYTLLTMRAHVDPDHKLIFSVGLLRNEITICGSLIWPLSNNQRNVPETIFYSDLRKVLKSE